MKVKKTCDIIRYTGEILLIKQILVLYKEYTQEIREQVYPALQ